MWQVIDGETIHYFFTSEGMHDFFENYDGEIGYFEIVYIN